MHLFIYLHTLVNLHDIDNTFCFVPCPKRREDLEILSVLLSVHLSILCRDKPEK